MTIGAQRLCFEPARCLDTITEEYESNFVLQGTRAIYTSKVGGICASMDDLRIFKRCIKLSMEFHIVPIEDENDEFSMLITIVTPALEVGPDTDLNAEYAAYCADHPIDSYRQGKNIGDLFIDLADKNGLFD